MLGRFGSSERSFMNLRSCARRMPLVLRLTIFTPFSAAMRMKPRISGWMLGSPPENMTTSGSPSERTNASRPASTWSIVSENPSGWCPESAKQIGQSRLQFVLTSMIPRHACCLCSGQRPQSSGQPSFTSVCVSSGIVPGLLNRSEWKYISASMTVLQTGQMLFVYSRKTSSRSTFCRSGVIVMAEPSCLPAVRKSVRTYFAHTALGRAPDDPDVNQWREWLTRVSAARRGGAVARVASVVGRCRHVVISRDRARLVLAAASAEPHEPPDARDAHDRAHPRVEAHPKDLVGGVDAHVLEEEPAERVGRQVQREHLAFAQPEPTLDPKHDAEQEEAVEGLVEERRVEGRVLQIAGRAIGRRDLETPRQLGGPAEQLLIEVVAPAADRVPAASRR